MTAIDWRSSDGQEVKSPLVSNRPALLIFWTSSCPNCQRERNSIDSQRARFEKAGLDVIGINLDNLLPGSGQAETKQLIDPSNGNAKLASQWQFRTSQATMDRIQNLQESLFNMYPPAVVPLSLLLDHDHQVLVIYRGAFEPDTFLTDMNLAKITTEQRRSAAVPLSGQWFTKPASDSEFIELVAKKMFSKDAQQSMRFFEASMLQASTETRQTRLQKQLVQSYLKLAKGSESVADATTHYEHALRLSDNQTKPIVHHEFGIFYAQSGDLDKAENQLQTALKLRPDYKSAQHNLRSRSAKKAEVNSVSFSLNWVKRN